MPGAIEGAARNFLTHNWQPTGATAAQPARGGRCGAPIEESRVPIQSWSDEILIVELQDDPVLSDDLNALIDQVKDACAVDVLIDFSQVSFLNSSNIAKLLKLRKIVSLAGRRHLVLCGANAHVWGVFLITGLEKLFEFADNVSLGLTAVQIKERPEER